MCELLKSREMYVFVNHLSYAEGNLVEVSLCVTNKHTSEVNMEQSLNLPIVNLQRFYCYSEVIESYKL